MRHSIFLLLTLAACSTKEERPAEKDTLAIQEQAAAAERKHILVIPMPEQEANCFVYVYSGSIMGFSCAPQVRP